LFVQLAVVGAFTLVLARLAFPQPPHAQAEEPPAFVYEVEAREWSPLHPTLRRIHERYGMDPDELAATLAANGGNECADPDRPLGYGDKVLIALSPDGGERCKRALEPRNR
jgi:hypothetical protein